MKILSANVAGAYLNAPYAKRIHTVLGPKFGELKGQTAVVVKTLHGLKSTGYSC